MISLTEIENFYPEKERKFSRNIIREYLQYKILSFVFNNSVSYKLSFIGGTCLRLRYGTGRFSEDLDFDNFEITEKEFEALANDVADNLRREGYPADISIAGKNAFRCNIKIPELLYLNKLSGYKEEKILIQLDTEAQGYIYEREEFLLNKFDVFASIFHTPKEVLLSQKLWAVLNSKQLKGRDLYDVTFLFGLTNPDYKYLEIKAGIATKTILKERILARLELYDLKKLSDDVLPFLMNPSDVNRILRFNDFIKAL